MPNLKSVLIHAIPLCWLLALASPAQPFDAAPFARRCPGGDTYEQQTTFDYAYARSTPPAFEKMGERFVYALQWAEERDIKEVQVQFAAPCDGKALAVEYWFQTWPYPPPTMPTMEDPVDDPWQGRWITAKTACEVNGQNCRLRFLPLDPEENPKATNLPGLAYRRTLKIRLVSAVPLPALQRVHAFTDSTQKPVSLRIELGVSGTGQPIGEGSVQVYNGAIQSVRGWKTNGTDSVSGTRFRISRNKGLIVEVLGTSPAPPGSHDVTIVTLRAGEQTFSFALPDVQKGPVYVPDFDSYVTLASDPNPFSPAIVKAGERIRDKLADEPEQTYERARRDIPPLDPVKRQGSRLYLPLALDSSWQKFALEWGGNVYIDKRAAKAKGAELRRLEWAGERLDWRFGTGATPSFRPESEDSKLSVLEDYLPVAVATWKTGDLEYVEEAFATALTGPLSCQDRDEQSPAVLLVKITARNTSAQPQVSHLWLDLKPAEPLRFEGNSLLAAHGELVRAQTKLATNTTAELVSGSNNSNRFSGLHLLAPLAPHATNTDVFALPFVPRLSPVQRQALADLDYERERSKVIAYWRPLADEGIRFQIPEQRFVSFSRAMLLHMHLSTAKDPRSGLFMVPAASYSYAVYANESCFQVLALDALGAFKTATDYLETFIQLQGSRSFRGTYTGDQRDVFHGARVAPGYDYTASEYNLDHGTVLWTLAEHYFATRDSAWFRHATPSMLRASDWITAQRRQTMVTDDGQPVPEYGLLPAGHLEDNADWGHWFAVNAYASAGMSRFAEALKDAGGAEAARIGADAEAYRRDLRQAVIRASQKAPVTRLRDNTFVPYVPVRPHQRQRLFGPLRVAYYTRYARQVLPTYRLSATREALYGPLILPNLGIFSPQERLSDWVLHDWEDNLTMSTSLGLNVHGWVDDEDWFSRGGMVFQANLQNPVLAYLRRREIPAAIRNLYNDFVACHYPEVNAFTEEYRQWRSPSGPFYKIPDEAKFVTRLRDLLVREEGQDLWLTAGTPRRWLAPGEQIRFRQMPTTFGPVDLELKARDNEVVGAVNLPARNPFTNAWLVLRLPAPKRIATVTVDGQPWQQCDRETGTIRLPAKCGGPLQLRVITSKE